jgi:hypothetical protein
VKSGIEEFAAGTWWRGIVSIWQVMAGWLVAIIAVERGRIETGSRVSREYCTRLLTWLLSMKYRGIIDERAADMRPLKLK